MNIGQKYIKTPIFYGTFGFFLFMQITGWLPLRFWGRWGGGNFLDSWQVLKAVDCYTEIGLEVYKLSNECMIYAYGQPLLTVLRFLHIGASQASAAGLILMVLVAWLISYSVLNSAYSSKTLPFLVAGIICSPPILLLVDRGNLDTGIASIIVATALLHARGKSGIAIVMLFLMTLFKYYTAPVLFLMILISKRIRDRIFALTLSIIAAVTVYKNLQITEFTLNFKSTNITFGLGHEFLYLSNYEKLSWVDNYYQFFGLGLLSTLVIFSFLYSNKLELSRDFSTIKSDTRIVYLMSTITLIGCFMAGGNNDYRLILFVISWATFSSILKQHRDIKNSLTFLLFIILWLTFPSGGLEILGDFALSIYIGINLGYMLSVITQKRIKMLLK